MYIYLQRKGLKKQINIIIIIIIYWEIVSRFFSYPFYYIFLCEVRKVQIKTEK